MTLAIENGNIGAGSSSVETSSLFQRSGRRISSFDMRRQQAGFAHESALCLVAERLLHDLSQSKVENRHPDKKHDNEGKEELGEDLACHEAILLSRVLFMASPER